MVSLDAASRRMLIVHRRVKPASRASGMVETIGIEAAARRRAGKGAGIEGAMPGGEVGGRRGCCPLKLSHQEAHFLDQDG